MGEAGVAPTLVVRVAAVAIPTRDIMAAMDMTAATMVVGTVGMMAAAGTAVAAVMAAAAAVAGEATSRLRFPRLADCPRR